MKSIAQIEYHPEFESDYSGDTLRHNTLKAMVFGIRDYGEFMFNFSLEETEHIGEIFKKFSNGDLTSSGEIINGSNIVIDKETSCSCKRCQKSADVVLSVRDKGGRRIFVCRECSEEIGNVLFNIRQDVVFDSSSIVVYNIRATVLDEDGNVIQDGYVIEIGGKENNHFTDNLSYPLDAIEMLSKHIKNPEIKNLDSDSYECIHCGNTFSGDEDYLSVLDFRYCFHEDCIEEVREDLDEFIEQEKKLLVSCSI